MEHNWQSRSKPTYYKQLIYDKGAKNRQWRKNNLLKKQWSENGTAPCRRTEFDHYLTPYTKVNSKWVDKIYIEGEGARRAKIILKKKNKAEEFSLLYFETYYIVILTRASLVV